MSIKAARQLRKAMTEPERKLWSRLRDGRFDGIKFRRQHPLGPNVLDFYCEAAKLAIEVDGSQHAWQADRDEARTAWLKAHGCRVVRFWNNDVMFRLDDVLLAIAAEFAASPHPARFARHPLPAGEDKRR